ncbi:MAG: serine hydrolase [Defluviitaleaceae bacterium]|nr:serine hydrolase [Defluviitaleaceae bacterium]
MKRFFKKVAAVGLAAVMTVTGGVMAFAAPGQMGLRWLAESAGAYVDWVDGSVTVDFNGDHWVFTPDQPDAQRNGVDIALSNPIVIDDGRSVITFEDAAFLFADAGEFPQTVATAVFTALQSMEALGVVGLTMAIVDAQTGFTWAQGFGYADSVNGVRVDADTLFQVASTGKVFTAIAIMQLVEQGLIDLDAPIINYIPEFSMLPSPILGGDSDEVTVRMLLNNTSGITGNNMRGIVTNMGGHYQGQTNDLLDWLATRELSFPPGMAWEYSNNGWTLLGILATRILGFDNYFEGFVQLMEENVLAPLGMERSSVYRTAGLPNIAMPYGVDGTQEAVIFANSLAAGSMLSNANEMALFMHALLGDGGGIISPATLAYMKQIHTGDLLPADTMAQGLGFLHLPTATGLPTTGHGGTLIQYHTEMIFDLDSGIGVFVSTNTVMGMHVASPVAGTVLEMALVEKNGYVAQQAQPETDPYLTHIELTEAQLAEFIKEFGGLYFFGQAGIWSLELMDGMAVFAQGHTILPLTPMSDGSFDAVSGRYTFQMVDGMAISILSVGGTEIPAVRIDDIEVLAAPAGFEQWVGIYDFTPQIEGDTAVIERVIISLNEHGMAMITIMQAGVVMPVPLGYYEGRWFLRADPLTFSVENGVAELDLMGGRFVRQ